MGRNIVDLHDFYCLKCGNKGIPLARRRSLQHEKFHRKKLYCIYCKTEVNHIECRNEKEVRKFKADFAAGVYENEAKESILHCGNSSIGKNKFHK